MKLKELLLEASILQPHEAIKELRKNPITKILFQKQFKPKEITNPDQVVNITTSLILNNPNIYEFVKARSGIKNIFLNDLTYLRKQYNNLSDEEKVDYLDQLQQFISLLSKEVNIVTKATPTPTTKREILQWVNQYGGLHRLSPQAVKDLESLIDIRPNKQVLVYRGILYNKYHLETNYDGSDGSGMKLLKSIRQGTRMVDLSYDRVSSWTYDKEVAERFARFRSAHGNFDATLGWLHRTAEKRYIDGELGFVLAIAAKPEDILADLSVVATPGHRKHGSEGEILLKPGKYLAKIIHMYNVEGEIDPTLQRGHSQELNKAFENVELFKKRVNFNTLSQFKEISSRHYFGDEYNKPETIKPLMDATGPLIELYDQFIKVGHELFGDITSTTLTHLKSGLDRTNKGQVQKFKELERIVQKLNSNLAPRRSNTSELLHTLDGITAFKKLPAQFPLSQMVRQLKTESGDTNITPSDLGDNHTIKRMIQRHHNKKIPLHATKLETQQKLLTPIWEMVVNAADRPIPKNYNDLLIEAIKIINRVKRTNELYDTLKSIAEDLKAIPQE